MSQRVLADVTTEKTLAPMVYLLDSGITSHPDVEQSKILKVFSNTNCFQDEVGHGTAMAYLIQSVAPKTKVAVIKISNSLNASEEQVFNALRYIKEFGVKKSIVSINWIMEKSIFLNAQMGSMLGDYKFVAAAGNLNRCVDDFFPAGIEGVITVGSVNKSGDITQHSNYSGCKRIDFYLPGTNISVPSLKGGQRLLTGTSASSALLAGLLARPYFKKRSVESVKRHIVRLKTNARMQLISNQ